MKLLPQPLLQPSFSTASPVLAWLGQQQGSRARALLFVRALGRTLSTGLAEAHGWFSAAWAG